MRLPSVPTRSIIDHLNVTYFHKVWNAPDDHGRVNFKLNKAAERLQIGAIPVGYSVVGLPTTDKVYAVYRASPQLFGKFIAFPDNAWVKDTEIVHSDLVSAFAYTNGGRMLPPGSIYFRYDPVRSQVLVAIDKRYTAMCTGQSFPDLHMTVYFDTIRVTRTIQQVITVTPSGVTSPEGSRQTILATLATYPASTMVYVNGWLYDATTIPVLAVGDIVYLSTDPDIIGYCDLSIDDNVTGYNSVLYQHYREILHIPKALNPHNYIITSDTLDVGVFDITTKKGVYGHRVDIHALESITHNDFSMSRSVLQGFQNSLSSQGVFVRLYVRYATQTQILENDINHIKDLYTLSDAEIKKQLANLSTHQITEWKASHLEQSAFLTLLYDFNGFTGSNLLSQYTSALGYYDVASTLAQSMHYYTYKGAEVEIKKPKRLIGYPCQVLVYADGRKVPEDAIGLSHSKGASFDLGFETGSYVSLESRIAVYVAEGGLRIPKPFNPTTLNPSIITDSDDYELVRIVSYSTPQQVWSKTTNKGYRPVPLSPGDYQIIANSNGTFTYRVSAPNYGKQFYLIPTCGLSTTAYPLDTLLANKKPITVSLEMSDTAGVVIPLVGTYSLEVYINGYRLIEGLDYTCDPIVGPNNDVLQVLLQVSNMEYVNLSLEGNVLEVVIHGDEVVSEDKGYVISNLMYRDDPPMLWSKSCGRAFVRGKLIEDVNEQGNILISSSPVSDASPYLLEWNIPYSVKKLMTNLSVNSDQNLQSRINELLELIPPTYPDTISITDQYTLYSPYLAQIISDVVAETYTIINEPQDDLFLNQFSKYLLLKDRDPVIGSANPLVDRRFVTLAAHYANFAVQDPNQLFLVQRLITLLLTPSQLSITEVLI